MSDKSKPTLSYDGSRWKIEIFPMNTYDYLVFTYIGESSRGDGKIYPHRLKPTPTLKNYKRVSIVVQAEEYEFVVVYRVDIHRDYCDSTKTIGYDIYHIMVYPDVPNKNGVKVVRAFWNMNNVSFLKTTGSLMFFMFEHSGSREPLIYSVKDGVTLGEWVAARESNWCIPDGIQIDGYHDNPTLPTLVTGRITYDFEMRFEIDLRKGHFRDGFRAITPCKSKLHKKPIRELIGFYDVNNFIRSNLNNLNTADFYMKYGGFYIGNEKLPVLKNRYYTELAVWKEIAKRKLLEANDLIGSEPVKREGLPQVFSGFKVRPGIDIRPVDNTLIVENDGKYSILESNTGGVFCSFCQIGEKSFIGIAEEAMPDGEVAYNVRYYIENELGEIVYLTGHEIFPCCNISAEDFFSSDDDDIVYMDNHRYSISEDRAIEEARIDASFRLEYFFSVDKDGKKVLVEAREHNRIYFLATVQKEDSGYGIKIFDKVYNAYTGTIFSGISDFDQIYELESQNREWEDWAKAEIKKIAP